MTIPWWAWGVLGSVGVVTCEALYRGRAFDSYLAALPYLLPAALVIQPALFYLYRDAPSFLAAWGLFFSLNLAARIAVGAGWFGEPLPPRVLLGLGLAVLAAWLVRASPPS